MTAPAPLLVGYDGESLVPCGPVWAKRADNQLVIGQQYRVQVVEERSAASHAHFFACIAEAHANLPDHLAERFADPEALRKYALCMTGHRDERSIVCSSKAEARRVAAFIEPMDAYAIVSVTEAVVVVWTARSQSVRAMGKAAFQSSKDKVLDFIASLLGVTPETLERERAA